MNLKIHTLAKGLIWELLGVIILFLYTYFTTGSLGTASAIGIGYPAFRVLLWYPYERLFKRIRRNWLLKNRERYQISPELAEDSVPGAGSIVIECEGLPKPGDEGTPFV